MGYMSAKEASERWGISQRRVAILCAEHRIAHAERKGNMWLIPDDAEKPADARSSRYMQTGGKSAKPFLKWAGGKGQLIEEIEQYYPFDDKRFTKYAEPFVGGGAVLFDVLNKFNLDAVYISDINAELINSYNMVRDRLDDLLEELSAMQADFLPLDTDARKAYYLAKRCRFNELTLGGEKANTEKAALMLFLNKTCFNGLYRVNRKGLFNVPMGAYRNPLICDEENLRAVSRVLKNVEIVRADYTKAASFIDANTFAYFDPPYRPLTQTADFTAYTADLFDDAQQIRLVEFVNIMNGRGAKIVMSNSDRKGVRCYGASV